MQMKKHQVRKLLLQKIPLKTVCDCRRLHVQITSSLKSWQLANRWTHGSLFIAKQIKDFGINDIFQDETDEATSSQMLQPLSAQSKFFEQKNDFQ